MYYYIQEVKEIYMMLKKKRKEVIKIDHVLEAINSHYEVYRNLFMEEHRTGEYKRFSDNPYYEEVKAIIDAMNILRKYLGWETIKLKNEVEFYL